MKKSILKAILTSAVIITALTACAVKKPGEVSNEQKPAAEAQDQKEGSSGGYELALVTDVGTIDDKSFNQGSWEGLEKYAKEHNITHKYYKPSEKSDEACLNAIDLAIKGGAKLVVTPGFLFEHPLYIAQTKYPDTKFIIIDAAPTNEGEVKVESNVHSIFYAEEQAGYLAGYAAVKEGYKKLGFMGGIAVPAVVKFGYGFIQGADAASKDLGLAKDEISIKYTYVGNFDSSPENMAIASAWYKEGVDCIFACGGGVGNSVMKAAETAGKVVIGVDVDQSSESETVITSAMKNLQDSVYNAIDAFYNDKFEGGVSVTLSAKDNGIKLPVETSKFKKFTKEDYNSLYEKLSKGEIVVENDKVATEASKVPVENITVEDIK